MKKMTKKEAFDLLKNRKIFVGDKSKELQKKLQQIGYHWVGNRGKEAKVYDWPIYALFLEEGGAISHSSSDYKDFAIAHCYEPIDPILVLDIELEDDYESIQKTLKEDEVLVITKHKIVKI
jgi:hypothetical protein